MDTTSICDLPSFEGLFDVLVYNLKSQIETFEFVNDDFNVRLLHMCRMIISSWIELINFSNRWLQTIAIRLNHLSLGRVVYRSK
jgi:hypothetical protein